MNYILARFILENSSSNKKVVSLNTVIQCMISVIPFMYCSVGVILNLLGNLRLLQTNLIVYYYYIISLFGGALT